MASGNGVLVTLSKQEVILGSSYSDLSSQLDVSSFMNDNYSFIFTEAKCI